MEKSDSIVISSIASSEVKKSASWKKFGSNFYAGFILFSAAAGLFAPTPRQKEIGGAVALIAFLVFKPVVNKIKSFISKINIKVMKKSTFNTLENNLNLKDKKISELTGEKNEMKEGQDLFVQNFSLLRIQFLEEGMNRVIGERLSIRPKNLILIGWTRKGGPMILYAKRKNANFKHEIGARYLIRNATGETKGILQVTDITKPPGGKHDVTLQCVAESEREYWDQLKLKYHSDPLPNSGDYLFAYSSADSIWSENKTFIEQSKIEEEKS